jgi:D-glycero-alpha-D-manno-heptose 1-phosphate guanylyltransferase
MKPATSLADVTAVLLVGGLGTRLRAVVPDRPKALAIVAGRPFLAWVLDWLDAAGIRRAVLCTGHRGDELRAACGVRHGGLVLEYSEEPEALGTGGALAHALPLLTSEPVLVLNGDSLCRAPLDALWQTHRSRAASATLLLSRVDEVGRYGVVRVGSDCRVERFVEKGAERGPGWISAGVYLLDQRFLRSIPAGGSVSLEHDVFPAWVGKGLYAHAAPGAFIDIGTPDAYSAAELFFTRQT